MAATVARYHEIFSHLFDGAVGVVTARCLCGDKGRCVACMKEGAVQEMIAYAMDVASLVQRSREKVLKIDSGSS